MKLIAARRMAGMAAFACACMGSACGGGGSTSASTTPAVPTTAAASRATAPVHLSFVLPKKTTSAKARSAEYVSTSTQSLTITVTPSGGTALTPIEVACTATCTASFQAPVGSDVIALKLTDGANGTGNQLSLSSTAVNVAADTANTFNLTANPVVSSVSVLLSAVPAATTSTNGGIAVDVPVNVNAMDADGNTIVGPGHYVDTAGNPITITLGVTNAQAGGTGTVALSQSSFTAPATMPVTAHYDGAWLDHSVIAVQAPAAIAADSSAATLSTVPTAATFSTGITPASDPFDIMSGPDGNLWFTELAGARVARMTTAGTVTEFSEGPTASAQVAGLTTGADGNIWFTKRAPDMIARMTPAGVVTGEFPGGNAPREIILGPDGNYWVTQQGGTSIDRFTPAGVDVSFPTGGTTLIGAANGPDGNVWFTGNSTFSVGKVSTGASPVATTYASASADAHYIAAGPDGNLWYTNNGGAACIGRVTTAGVSTPFCSGITSAGGTAMGAIVAGPDGNMWFTNTDNGILAKITPAGVVTEYTAGIPVNSQPYGLTVGPDHSLWFTERGTNSVARFTL